MRAFTKYTTKDNKKNLWKCIFRASWRVTFSYFPKITLDSEWVCVCVCERESVCVGGRGRGGEGWPLLPFRIFVDCVTIFYSSPIGSCYIELCLKCERAPKCRVSNSVGGHPHQNWCPPLKMKSHPSEKQPPSPPLKRETPFHEIIPRKSTINNNLKSR